MDEPDKEPLFIGLQHVAIVLYLCSQTCFILCLLLAAILSLDDMSSVCVCVCTADQE